ncbi:MAG: hypothetical protein U5L72_11265 [Bacteroidales bacterium]|nr:hypothetical protein [Bacteroidales bacterium]
MDKNTITGIVLIFLIFLGFSFYNNQKSAKVFEAETEYADSLYAAGDYDDAREAYVRALGYRPKDQPTMDRVVELNSKLGLVQPVQQTAPAAAPCQSFCSDGNTLFLRPGGQCSLRHLRPKCHRRE